MSTTGRSLDFTHWSVQSGLESTFRSLPFAVAIVHVAALPGASATSMTSPVGVYLNPSDQRGYRLIFRPLVSCTPSTALDESLLGLLPHNRFPSMLESVSLGVACSAIGDLFWHRCGLFLQTYQLGNNSQAPITEADLALDAAEPKETSDASSACASVGLTRNDQLGGINLCGNEHEPFFLHVHGVLRGDPTRSYFPSGAAKNSDDSAAPAAGSSSSIASVPALPALGGPPIGVCFPMKAPPGTPHSQKVPWPTTATPGVATIEQGTAAVRLLLREALEQHAEHVALNITPYCRVEVLV